MEDPTYFNFASLDDFGLSTPRFDMLPSPGWAGPSSYSLLTTPTPQANTTTGASSSNCNSYFQLPLSSHPASTTTSLAACAPAPRYSLKSTTPTEQGLTNPYTPSTTVKPIGATERFITRQTVDGVILNSSENIQKFLGYDALSLRDTSIYELIHPEDVDTVLQVHLKLIGQVGRSPITSTYRILRRTGEYTEVESVFSLESGSDISVLCSSADLHPPRYSPTPSFYSEDQLAPSVSFGSDDQASLFHTATGALPAAESLDNAHEAFSPETHSHSSHSSPPHYHSSSDDLSDDDGTYSSASGKIRAKPKARSSSATVTAAGAPKVIARTSHGNPKRERRMRRPPFGDHCGECHAPESTEWRKGPTPDHLLCNACGLRYTRKVKKERGGK